MDGVHPLCVWCVEWRWRVLLLASTVSGVARAPPIPVQYLSVLLSCRALSRCQVCGVRVVSISPRSLRGGVSCVCSPLVVVVGVGIVDGWVVCVVVGGIVMEGRQCCGPPRLISVSPLFVREVALVEG